MDNLNIKLDVLLSLIELLSLSLPFKWDVLKICILFQGTIIQNWKLKIECDLTSPYGCI